MTQYLVQRLRKGHFVSLSTQVLCSSASSLIVFDDTTAERIGLSPLQWNLIPLSGTREDLSRLVTQS